MFQVGHIGSDRPKTAETKGFGTRELLVGILQDGHVDPVEVEEHNSAFHPKSVGPNTQLPNS